MLKTSLVEDASVVPRVDVQGGTIVWESCDDYEIVSPLGAGKYSRVFEGRRCADNRTVAIKVLKPTPFWKVKREVEVLRCLAGGPHIVELIGTCCSSGGVHIINTGEGTKEALSSANQPRVTKRQTAPNTYCLVMEHCGTSKDVAESSRNFPAFSLPVPSDGDLGRKLLQRLKAASSWLIPWFERPTSVALAGGAQREGGPNAALFQQQQQQQQQQGQQSRRRRQLPARRLAHNDFPKWRPLTDHEVRWALFQLLEALEFAHSQKPFAVMHRDVKPSNVLVRGRGVPALKLTLVDFGLAEFHRPGRRYVTRVASRYYKAPELLMGDDFYGPSLDLWGVGCVLAGLVFRKEPFFKGTDNVDQLATIASVVGSESLVEAADRHLKGGFKSLNLDLRQAITNTGRRGKKRRRSRGGGSGGGGRDVHGVTVGMPPRRPWVPEDMEESGGVEGGSSHRGRWGREGAASTPRRPAAMSGGVGGQPPSALATGGGGSLERGDRDRAGNREDAECAAAAAAAAAFPDEGESEEGERQFDPYAEVVGSARLSSPEALDLIALLLNPDREQRPSASQALQHPYFDPVRDFSAGPRPPQARAAGTQASRLP